MDKLASGAAPVSITHHVMALKKPLLIVFAIITACSLYLVYFSGLGGPALQATGLSNDQAPTIEHKWNGKAAKKAGPTPQRWAPASDPKLIFPYEYTVMHGDDGTVIPHAAECLACDSCMLTRSPTPRFGSETWFSSKGKPNDGSSLNSMIPTTKSLPVAASRRLLGSKGTTKGRKRSNVDVTSEDVNQLLKSLSLALIPSYRHDTYGYAVPERPDLIEHCPVCHGCAHDLVNIMEPTTFAGVTTAAESGKTNAHLFRTDHPFASKGKAVVKVLCMQYSKESNIKTNKLTCDNKYISNVMSANLAQQKLRDEGGFESVIPKLWVGPVSSWTADKIMFIDWDGLWIDRVPGVSLTTLTLVAGQKNRKKSITIDRNIMRDVIQSKIKSTDVTLIAVWDLLTMQCDSHGENVFVSEEGHLSRVDLDESFGTGSVPCGFNSLFIPTSQEHAVALLGENFVMKQPNSDPPTKPDNPKVDEIGILSLLDYRCHSPGGVIGTKYPPKVVQLLKRLRAMTVLEVQLGFGLSEVRATRLQRRAADMITHGFEWTLRHGLPQNPAALTYLMTPPCCDAEILESTARCKVPGFSKWNDGADTLPCGDEGNAIIPASYWEPTCHDPDGRRRKGLWKSHYTYASGWPARPVSDLEMNPKIPIDGAYVPVTNPDWASKQYAGTWPEGTLESYFLGST